mmetsp:Transcript_6162/g.23280  ORF Transcript_6162/g.23280 Transcript_6162/m.23280 type:complete len:83 (-) Transcript_6162:1147-1395(-)
MGLVQKGAADLQMTLFTSEFIIHNLCTLPHFKTKVYWNALASKERLAPVSSQWTSSFVVSSAQTLQFLPSIKPFQLAHSPTT